MRHLLLATLLATLAAHGSAQQPGTKPAVDPKQKPDTELIQGTWLIVGLEAGGKAEPDRNYRNNTIVFIKDKATLQERSYSPIDFTLALDPTKTPKTIDLTTKGNVLNGIYKLDGDDLTICLSIGGKRPAEFATKPGGDLVETFVLKRSNWETFTEKAVGFSVDLPSKQPTVKSQNIDTPAGSSTMTTYTVRSEMERVSYSVSVTLLPGKLDAKDIEAALDSAQKALIADVDSSGKAKVEPEGKFKAPPGLTAARELTISFERPDSKDRGAMRARLLVSGDYLYTLSIAGNEEGTRSPNVFRFWNSFKLPTEKK
jgi:uncharacterized protein (TIGR03067 family)